MRFHAIHLRAISQRAEAVTLYNEYVINIIYSCRASSGPQENVYQLTVLLFLTAKFQPLYTRAPFYLCLSKISANKRWLYIGWDHAPKLIEMGPGKGHILTFSKIHMNLNESWINQSKKHMNIYNMNQHIEHDIKDLNNCSETKIYILNLFNFQTHSFIINIILHVPIFDNKQQRLGTRLQ